MEIIYKKTKMNLMKSLERQKTDLDFESEWFKFFLDSSSFMIYILCCFSRQKCEIHKFVWIQKYTHSIKIQVCQNSINICQNQVQNPTKICENSSQYKLILSWNLHFSFIEKTSNSKPEEK